MGKDGAYWIEKLQLTKHPEGGAFREVYRSGLIISKNNLPTGFNSNRNFSTSIYFLLEDSDFSAFHRIRSDELWNFYSGDPVIVSEIDIFSGALVKHKLGNDPEKGEVFQTVIRARNWFGASLLTERGYALMGCTVSPGFDFEDFELGKRDLLTQKFPQHQKLIEALTR
jgi:uncharacterized protein